MRISICFLLILYTLSSFAKNDSIYCYFNEQSIVLKKNDVLNLYGKPLINDKKAGCFKVDNSKKWIKYGKLYYEDFYIVYYKTLAFHNYMKFYQTTNSFIFEGNTLNAITTLDDVLRFYKNKEVLVDHTVCQLFSIDNEFYFENGDKINHVIIDSEMYGMIELVFYSKKLYAIIIHPQGVLEELEKWL
ncbi:hypothetical protein KDU71_20540 [Carboxylicivirga sediminis]|uniref:Organic solvent tolerance-like N-terminal domain-containing protein n=1 Tax=Carboxylicivirga sediminis TaxID=2006564 RepID=A0A941F7K8_9BACT|nr:hypothetical protein [Carboxylicivirga sediminis]MBR8537969.1 hypothetical protein [Carboxylicivirga sediminis]